MNRRTNKMNGFVNFPVGDTRYRNSGEGGMFVRLVVIDSARHIDAYWMQCCGGYNYVYADEIYTGRDESTHFPHLREGDGDLRYLSIGYLAAMTIGSTGWSGWNDDDGYWQCTENDLTEEGKALLEMLRTLYKGCEVKLQTWLDT